LNSFLKQVMSVMPAGVP